jgi:hypothetical protein
MDASKIQLPELDGVTQYVGIADGVFAAVQLPVPPASHAKAARERHTLTCVAAEVSAGLGQILIAPYEKDSSYYWLSITTIGNEDGDRVTSCKPVRRDFVARLLAAQIPLAMWRRTPEIRWHKAQIHICENDAARKTQTGEWLHSMWLDGVYEPVTA